MKTRCEIGLPIMHPQVLRSSHEAVMLTALYITLPASDVCHEQDSASSEVLASSGILQEG